MPKCYKLLSFIEWTGGNLTELQDFVNQWAGAAQYTNNDGTLTIDIPGYPSRTATVGTILVTPYLDTYPSMSAFVESYGVIGG